MANGIEDIEEIKDISISNFTIIWKTPTHLTCYKYLLRMNLLHLMQTSGCLDIVSSLNWERKCLGCHLEGSNA